MVHVWTVGEEATFAGPRQAGPSILSSRSPHLVSGERRSTGCRASPRHVDKHLGTGVDIGAKGPSKGLYRCGPLRRALPANLDRDDSPSGQTVGWKAWVQSTPQ